MMAIFIFPPFNFCDLEHCADKDFLANYHILVDSVDLNHAIHPCDPSKQLNKGLAVRMRIL